MALAPLALGGGLARARRPAAVLDTHTHFYDPRRPQGVPWPPPTDPFLHRPVLPPEYEALARPLGVTGTVVVEASAWIEDNQWVLDLAGEHPFILGVVGRLSVGRPTFGAELARFARHPLFRGIRVGGQTVTDLAALRDLEALAEAGLALDVLCGPEHLGGVGALAARLPALRIVVDHVGGVRIDGRPPPQSWRTAIAALGRHENVFCKASGLVEGAAAAQRPAPAEPSHYGPVLDAVWSAFGEDRLLYASNWPVSARFGSLATVQSIVTAYIATKAPAAAPKFFAGNARRAYALRG